jgi:hypothetical protein
MLHHVPLTVDRRTARGATEAGVTSAEVRRSRSPCQALVFMRQLQDVSSCRVMVRVTEASVERKGRLGPTCMTCHCPRSAAARAPSRSRSSCSSRPDGGSTGRGREYGEDGTISRAPHTPPSWSLLALRVPTRRTGERPWSPHRRMRSDPRQAGTARPPGPAMGRGRLGAPAAGVEFGRGGADSAADVAGAVKRAGSGVSARSLRGARSSHRRRRAVSSAASTR